MSELPEREIETLIKNRLEQSKDSMLGPASTWDLSRRFLRGIHYKGGSNSVAGSRNEGLAPGMVRLTINLMLPIYERLLAMLGIVTPHVSARPASTVKADLVKAKTDAALAQYLWEKARVPNAYRDANTWLITCGTVGFHTFYDPDKEDVVVEKVTCYDLFVEPGVEDIDDSEYIMRRQYVSEAGLKRAYPDADVEKVNKVRMDHSQESVTKYNTSASAPPRSNERVEVMEYWDREGRHRIFSGTEVLFDGKGDKRDWDPAGRYPIRAVRFHRIPGEFYGVGALEPLIGPQREYNAQRSAIISNIRLMGNLQWLVPVNAGVDKITNRPGGVIRYNPAAPAPKQANLSPLPGYIMDNVSRTHSEMMDMAGIHGTSLGKRVSGIESGAAINALVEQDTHQLQSVLDEMERAAIDIANEMLRLAKVHYSKPRMIRIFKQDGGMFYRSIKNTDLSKEPDIFIEAGSLFASRINDRERRAVDLFKLGLLEPQEARAAINFNGQEAQMHKTIRHYNMALDILESIVAGDKVIIVPTDPINEIREVLEDFMHSDEYQEMDQETQDAITDVYVSLLSQGQAAVSQQLKQPLHPMQTPQPQAEEAPYGQQPQPQTSQGGTEEGAAQRTANQENARVYEGFDARSNPGS